MTLYVATAGAVTSIATGSGDLITAMVKHGLGVFAFVTLVLSQWTTNDNNIFSATNGLRGVFPRRARKELVAVFGVVATLFGVLGITGSFVDFLMWLGVAVPPIGGVLVAHYLVGRPPRPAPSVAFAAWSLGVVVGKVILWGAPALNSIVVAGLFYRAALYVRDRVGHKN